MIRLDDELLVPCPDCRRAGPEHLVPCWVDDDVLRDAGIDDPADLPLDLLYELFNRDDGVSIEDVCGDCGSDYTRDAEGRIID